MRLQEHVDELGGADLHHFGQAGDEVAPLYLLEADVRLLDQAADAHLYLLGGLGAYKHVVPAADIADYRLVEFPAGDADGLALGHAVQGDDGGFRGAAADVDDKVAVRL